MVVGEGSNAPIKETNPVSFQCPMLTSTNYTIWSMRMEVIFGIYGVWDVIDPGSNDAKKNNMAKALLFQSIPEEQILQIGNLKLAKEMWEAIQSRNLGAERVKEARLQTLITEFDGLKMRDTGTIDEYASKLSSIASKAATLGEKIEERKMVKKLFTSLPRRFIHIVASLEQVLDLKTVGYEDVVGRLKAYEERIKEEDNAYDNSGKLMFSKSESSSSRGHDSSRGRGRGSHSSRGRDRGQDNTQNRGPQEENKTRDNGKQKDKKRDLSGIKCYRCDKYGHFVSRCPDRFKNNEANMAQAEEQDNEVDGTFFMMKADQETIFLKEGKVLPKKFEADSSEKDVWYLDNGASNHMTGNRSYFVELNERITGSVKFGDGSRVTIKGKGSILFEGKTGEQKLLTDIYYIPDLQSNVMSLGQVTEFGCEIRMKDNFLTMFDSGGKLLMRVARSKNRLYKVKLKVGTPVCLMAKTSEDSWLWHARLRHASFKTLEKMNGMVLGVPKIRPENKVCEACMVGTQMRKPLAKKVSAKIKEMRDLLGIEDLPYTTQKFRG
ncbi:putative RNA-directed DNA polymerase [Helianthus annuus]|nr:putative RNA-directed DNA polymerase [Helianthus annuus]KAJ0886343.1 putative RNA-directed DNA polymerase [Helianthus annuus]